jgi:hypothetical protein
MVFIPRPNGQGHIIFAKVNFFKSGQNSGGMAIPLDMPPEWYEERARRRERHAKEERLRRWVGAGIGVGIVAGVVTVVGYCATRAAGPVDVEASNTPYSSSSTYSRSIGLFKHWEFTDYYRSGIVTPEDPEMRCEIAYESGFSTYKNMTDGARYAVSGVKAPPVDGKVDEIVTVKDGKTITLSRTDYAKHRKEFDDADRLFARIKYSMAHQSKLFP